MKRKEFIKMCGLFGIGYPILNSCNLFTNSSNLKPTDKVLIIGAGAAGLSAAYLLNQKGIYTEILEASSNYGGRMKRTTAFADFPIPTGAEWLHTKRSVLNKIINDKSVKVETVTKTYDTEKEYALIDGRKDELKTLGFTIDQKFINSTWFDFYDQYIVPSIKDKIRLKEVVTSIDYLNQKITVKTIDNEFIADKVILTVPVKMLQNSSIEFKPKLPIKKSELINSITVWDGCKAFIEFSEKFYPAATGFNSIPENQGHKMFYDASYGQNTKHNILGVFAVGPISKPYLERNGDELKNYLLAELDEVYNGQATPNYKKHIFQNWSEEPFTKSAYVHYFESWNKIRNLGKPVNNKLYFAGDAYTDGSEWSSVHAAANSAKKVVEKLIG